MALTKVQKEKKIEAERKQLASSVDAAKALHTSIVSKTTKNVTESIAQLSEHFNIIKLLLEKKAHQVGKKSTTHKQMVMFARLLKNQRISSVETPNTVVSAIVDTSRVEVPVESAAQIESDRLEDAFLKGIKAQLSGTYQASPLDLVMSQAAASSMAEKINSENKMLSPAASEVVAPAPQTKQEIETSIAPYLKAMKALKNMIAGRTKGPSVDYSVEEKKLRINLNIVKSLIEGTKVRKQVLISIKEVEDFLQIRNNIALERKTKEATLVNSGAVKKTPTTGYNDVIIEDASDDEEELSSTNTAKTSETKKIDKTETAIKTPSNGVTGCGDNTFAPKEFVLPAKKSTFVKKPAVIGLSALGSVNGQNPISIALYKELARLDKAANNTGMTGFFWASSYKAKAAKIRDAISKFDSDHFEDSVKTAMSYPQSDLYRALNIHTSTLLPFSSGNYGLPCSWETRSVINMKQAVSDVSDQEQYEAYRNHDFSAN